MRTLAIDIETTGLDLERDQIIQIAWNLDRIRTRSLLVRPTIPIEAEATEVHGITYDQLSSERTFMKLAAHIQSFIDRADRLMAYNAGFDLSILDRQLREAGEAGIPHGIEIIDPLTTFRAQVPHTLASAYRFYLGRDLVGAHDARVDVRAMLEVRAAQERAVEAGSWSVDTLEHTGADWAGYFSKDRDGVRFAFGKHRGELVDPQEHAGYLSWMLDNDFPEQTKDFIAYEILGVERTLPEML